MAKEFFKGVYRLHRLPRKIVSDIVPLLTLNFWKVSILRTELHFLCDVRYIWVGGTRFYAVFKILL